MTIGKTRTIIRAEIDTQYEILLQMIEDIADHYQEEECIVRNEIDKVYEEALNYDYETSSSMTQGYGDVLDNHHRLSAEARKILFCSIFSFLESMLYRIINIYKIKRHGERVLTKISNVITREYEKKYDEDIVFNEDSRNMIFSYYRPLRNFFMHGNVDDPLDRRNLLILPDIEHSIKRHDDLNFEITDNVFLFKVLNMVKAYLDSIEEAYNNKTKELWILNHK